jgi:hypothetical protein
MFRQALSIGLTIVAALMALAAQAQDRLVLKSLNVDLPFGDRMFQGPGSEVEKMLTAYKAPIDPKDVDAIVNSLMSIQQAK